MDSSSPAFPSASAAARRAEQQTHLDQRLARLRAYEAALTQELAAGARDERSVQVDGQLTQVRRDIRVAARATLSRADSRGARAVPLGLRRGGVPVGDRQVENCPTGAPSEEETPV